MSTPHNREESFSVLESGDPAEVKSFPSFSCSSVQLRQWISNFPLKVSAELERLHTAGCALGPALLVKFQDLVFGSNIYTQLMKRNPSKSSRQQDKKVLVESQVSRPPASHVVGIAPPLLPAPPSCRIFADPWPSPDISLCSLHALDCLTTWSRGQEGEKLKVGYLSLWPNIDVLLQVAAWRDDLESIRMLLAWGARSSSICHICKFSATPHLNMK